MLDLRDEKTSQGGKAAIGAISTHTERLVAGYLAALSASLRGRSKPSLVVPKAFPGSENG